MAVLFVDNREAQTKRPLAKNILQWRDCVCDLFQVLSLWM